MPLHHWHTCRPQFKFNRPEPRSNFSSQGHRTNVTFAVAAAAAVRQVAIVAFPRPVVTRLFVPAVIQYTLPRLLFVILVALVADALPILRAALAHVRDADAILIAREPHPP